MFPGPRPELADLKTELEKLAHDGYGVADGLVVDGLRDIAIRLDGVLHWPNASAALTSSHFAGSERERDIEATIKALRACAAMIPRTTE